MENYILRGKLMKLCKKGAMFGLDARIALVIFGALSMISGAALYSAIQEAKIARVVAQINEMDKALSAYHMDTGHAIPKIPTITDRLDLRELITSTESGWKGPYFPFATTGYNLAPNYGGAISVSYGLKDSTNTTRASCTNIESDTCGYWFEWYSLEDDIEDQIDILIDGSSDPQNGNVRICDACGGDGVMLVLIGS
ncbi:MAG TPA: hypothetical protein DCL21_05605 [Alphaproteobacteria bacterium]|nr:hypothetical protein [Alphaproteobacteria bacterium]